MPFSGSLDSDPSEIGWWVGIRLDLGKSSPQPLAPVLVELGSRLSAMAGSSDVLSFQGVPVWGEDVGLVSGLSILS